MFEVENLAGLFVYFLFFFFFFFFFNEVETNKVKKECFLITQDKTIYTFSIKLSF